MTPYCLSSAIAAHLLQTLPSSDIRGCSLRMGWEKSLTMQTPCGNQGLNLSVNLRSESGNESAFSCAWAAKQPVLGGGGRFLSSALQCAHFISPLDYTQALARDPTLRGPPSPVSVAAWLCSLRLATVLFRQGVANLVQDWAVPLGTNPANTSPPPPPPCYRHRQV